MEICFASCVPAADEMLKADEEIVKKHEYMYAWKFLQREAIKSLAG